MIELYSRDMSRVIAFARKVYRMSFPDDVTTEEIEHEVAVALFKSRTKINTTTIINQLRWTRAVLWAEKSNKEKTSLHDGLLPYEQSIDDAIDSKAIAFKITKVQKLSSQEKELLRLLAKGLDTRQICAKMKINSRQRFEQIKKVAFFKVRTLCPEAEYWGTNEQAIPRTTRTMD